MKVVAFHELPVEARRQRLADGRLPGAADAHDDDDERARHRVRAGQVRFLRGCVRMKALMIEPGTPDSLRLEDVREPSAAEGALLVSALALGVCGTDRELIAGEYGEAPPKHKRLVIGHEALGVVESAPAGSPVRV